MIKKLYGFVLISLSLAILSQPLDAQVLSQLPKFEKWVGSQPDQEILGMTLFEHPTFRQGIEQLIPLQQWNELWKTYVFAQPVGQMDHWLVVSGRKKNNPGDTDMSIFLDTITQQVVGVCSSVHKRVYPVYTEEQRQTQPRHFTSITIRYYTLKSKLTLLQVEESDDCGRGDAEKAIKQWQALQILLGK